MRIILSFILSCLLTFSHAQEMLGLVNSNYAGVSGIRTNPAAMVNSPLQWDINILTADVFLENNYLYIPGTSLLRLAKADYSQVPFYTTPMARNGELSGGMPIRDHYNTLDKFGFASLTLYGPSAMLSVKQHSFAVYTAFRSVTSLTGLHYSIPKLAYEEMAFEDFVMQSFEVPGFRLNSMSWSEIGFSYGTVLLEDATKRIKAGATLKFLTSYHTAYLKNTNANYTYLGNKEVIVTDLNVEYGYVDPMSFADAQGKVRYKNLVKGRGFGADIGLIYERKEEDKNTYKWRVGASLLDLGSIRFSDNARNNRLAFTLGNVDWAKFDTSDIREPDFSSAQNMYDVDTTLSRLIYNDPNASHISNSFQTGLPTAFSLQGDYKVMKNVYVNAAWIQRIGHVGPAVSRMNQLAIAPRYETRWFEASLSAGLYEWRHLRMGTAVRVGSVTVGSDKLGSILFNNDFSGFDLYVSVKLNADKIKKDKPDKAKKRKRKKAPRFKSSLRCYDF